MTPTESHNQPSANSSKPRRWLTYKRGEEDAFGNKINAIIHCTQRGAIYITASSNPKVENLTWDEEENLPQHWTRSTAEAINLLTIVRRTIKNPADSHRALGMLAIGLGRALEEKVNQPDEDFLVGAREFITARQQEVLRTWYFTVAVATVVGASTLLPILAANVRPLAREFLIAALLGGLGAMLSVSQRFRSVPVERYSSQRYIAIGGCSRIIFGCFFGAAFLLFQKADVLLSFASEQQFLLAAASFVAGFSERAIPEMLEQFEPQIALGNAADKRNKSV